MSGEYSPKSRPVVPLVSAESANVIAIQNGRLEERRNFN